MIPTDQLEILIDKSDLLTSSELTHILECLPFERLDVVSILDDAQIRSDILFLMKIIERDEFSKNPTKLKQGLDFVVRILNSMDKINFEDIFGNLLKLLRKFVSKISVHDSNLESILQGICSATKLQIFQADNAQEITHTLGILLIHTNVVQSGVADYVSDIALNLQKRSFINELAMITSLVVKRFPPTSKPVNVCIPWLLTWGPTYLTRNVPKETALNLMMAMNEAYHLFRNITGLLIFESTELPYAIQTFTKLLPQVCEQILILCHDRDLFSVGLELFSIALSLNINQDQEKYHSELKKLPKDVTTWHECSKDVFFEIVAFLCTNSRPIWSSEKILSSISSLVYSKRRFSIDSNVLKHIAYIYPIVIVEHQNNKNLLLLGDDLLSIMMKNFNDEMFTCHVAQLVWILLRADDDSFVQSALCYWLKNGNNLKELAHALVFCKANSRVLKILQSEYIEDGIKSRTIEVINLMKDRILHTTIANSLIMVYKRPKIFKHFLFSNPGVSNNQSLTLRLCEFMSLYLLFICDEKILRSACIYAEKLLLYLKKEKKSVNIFLKDLRNIKYLLPPSKNANELPETLISKTNLLKSLIILQSRHGIVLDSSLKIDMTPFIQSNNQNILMLLTFVESVATIKNSFLIIETENIEHLIKKLLELCRNLDTASKSFSILTALMKKNKWLASIPSLAIMIQVHCSLGVQNDWQQFLLLLRWWMDIVQHSDIRYVPDYKIIRSYLLRVPNLPNSKLQQLLDTWDTISHRRRDKYAYMVKREF